MDIKYNEATLNRPAGDRVIDAPFVFIDLKKYTLQLKEESAWKKNDRNSITVHKTDGLTIVLTLLHNGAIIKDNAVDGHLTIHVLEGIVDFTIETGTIRIEDKQIITLHPGVLHTIQSLGNTLLLITNKMA